LSRTALLIIGMHRAGTSALARVCALRGAALPGQLLPANAGNPTGYWEPQGVTELNTRVLDHFQLDWDDPFAAAQLPPAAEIPAEFHAAARKAIAEAFGDAGLFVLKDPRCTLLQAFWREALVASGARVCPVVIMRPWAEVVDSLVRRDATAPVAGALLYVAYGLEAAAAAAEGASVVTYRQLTDDWRATTDRIAREQAFAWPSLDSQAVAAIDAYLRPSEQRTSTHAFASPVGGWVDRVWHWFEAVAHGVEPDAGILQPVASAFGQLQSAIAPLLRDRHRVRRSIEGERDAAIAERDTVLALYRDTDAQLRKARTDYETRNAEYLERSAELDAAQMELSQLRGVAGELALVLGSRSWKLTAPLRAVTRRLQRQRTQDRASPPAATVSGRRHAGLRAFLDAEFDPRTTDDVVARIEQFRLPVPGQHARTAEQLACTEHDAIAWATTIAARPVRALVDDPAPDVSIIVPVYNQVPFTLACIDALLQHESRYRFEILVGDDGSGDATAAALAVPLPGVRHIRHASNLGFVRNCNATAREARGRYLLFLNNDTLVLPGWLDELIGTLESCPDIGLAGSKLIYPDGKLQECGAIVWRDGSAWNYGRLGNPRAPEVCYRRDVDYVSGASIALPTPLWNELGGFDQHYAPAYAEDADLAFRVRDRGLRTVVQPLSQVLHFEGISSGTDLGAGAKAHQVANLQKLRERWAHVLAGHRDNADQPELEKERAVRHRVLFVDHCTPSPNEDAGSLVAVEIMRAFIASGYKVTFVPEDNFAHVGAHTRDLQRIGIEAIYHPAYARMSGFLSRRQDPFDTIFLHRFGVADAHLDALRRAYPAARVLFLNADLHYLRLMRQAELEGDAKALAQARRVQVRELQVIASSDVTLVHSDHEQALLRQAAPGKDIVLFPLIHEPAETIAPLDHRDGICFVGGFRHPPNADGIRWFVDAVWPLVRASAPQARLYVAGSHMPAEVRALAAVPGVTICGFIENLDAFLDQRRVSVAPLRYGAGAKGKVAGSLARGVPTVCTSIAAEGMGLQAGVNVLVGDTPQALAAHILVLLDDEAQWRRFSAAGLAYARAMTSRASAHQRMAGLLAPHAAPTR
jgi:GT2 family glycosyltransferase